ncbi:MAG: ABC transporter ATP-binding protein [Candidatus Cloacimonas sp.]|jgi:lipoprotein-releasing system ATP-binding protein|nr:ABC transporter ATP-binding protein [Candidatus Cloacimonadota bacterium]
MSLLEAVRITKSYPEGDGILNVLKGVDLQIKERETIAITGESGCGKSTLLHLLGLLDSPDSGDIVYKGAKVAFNQKRVAEFRNRNIGFIFQFHYLLDDFTVVENIAIPMFISSGNWTKSRGEAKKLLERINLKQRSKYYPNQLSGGEQQRVAILRALINKPEIILADEPTGNLDPKNSEEVISLMSELNDEAGCSLVIVTHNQEIADRMGKRYILKDGFLEDVSLS